MLEQGLHETIGKGFEEEVAAASFKATNTQPKEDPTTKGVEMHCHRLRDDQYTEGA